MAEPLICTECGNVIHENPGPLDIFGFHFVNKLCKNCVKSSNSQQAKDARKKVAEVIKSRPTEAEKGEG